MERLAVPWIFTGPSGSGKLSLARKWIEEAHGIELQTPFEVRTFSVGDGYEARVLASPYHFEIDIPNLSMQDKQIIGELLAMFLSSGDVLNSLRSSSRKLVILRRAHCLSLPAAIRVRAILQQYVLPANASGMIWFTAREITGPLSLLEDALVQHRVPRMTYADWVTHVPEGYRTEEAWKQLDGRIERADQMNRHFTTPPEWPRRIQDYYDEMLEMMVQGASLKKSPGMEVVEWIRERVYEVLSFCQTGPEIVDCCASALSRLAEKDIPPLLFWKSMDRLAESEPHTSYRTPLSLEWAFLTMYEEMRKSWAEINGGRTSEVAGSDGTKGQKVASSDSHRKTGAPKRTAATRGKV
jgi:hypothetical protein